MPEDYWNPKWIFLGLAFVGGYTDAASFILANTFTGHVTGNIVLTAVSIAAHDWEIFSRRVIALTLFFTGAILSVILERIFAGKSSRPLVPVVLSLEVVLISIAYFALTSSLAVGVKLFVCCTALAMGLQNGVWQEAGGITVHSTYVTGMTTKLLTTAAKRYISKAVSEVGRDPKISLLSGIWVAFIAGVALGAVLVSGFGALGGLGVLPVLLAMLVRQSVTVLRRL
jgi:uncharacterized membrane protein YoaK (UPF0700 family)